MGRRRGGVLLSAFLLLVDVYYYSPREFGPFLILRAASLRSQVLWLLILLLPAEQRPREGWQDTLSLVTEQGPILSPPPSPARSSILT